MSFGRRNRKMFIISGAVLLLLLILITRTTRKYEISTMINDTNPKDVWEFMSDFSRIRAVNPLVISVKCWERISHWPYWCNKATVQYIIKMSFPEVQNPNYTVESTHTTCFFKGLYCLSSLSDFTCRAFGVNTYCSELIVHQCPLLLPSLCRREVEHQRKTIMDNLTDLYSKRRF